SLRQWVLPKPIQGWTLTALREKLIKIGAKVVSHSKYVMFQLAEVAVPRELFARLLTRIGRLRLACASGCGSLRPGNRSERRRRASVVCLGDRTSEDMRGKSVWRAGLRPRRSGYQRLSLGKNRSSRSFGFVKSLDGIAAEVLEGAYLGKVSRQLPHRDERSRWGFLGARRRHQQRLPSGVCGR